MGLTWTMRPDTGETLDKPKRNRMDKMRKRDKYGLRKGSLKEAFSGIEGGGIRSFQLEDVNVASFRTRAGELNRDAGYTKYSVSVDKVAGALRLINNG